VTWPLHVPDFAPTRADSSRVSRRSWRRRPARDKRWICPNSSTIWSMLARAWAERPARDIDNSGCSNVARSRWRRWRMRSISRAAGSSALRRALACLARRCNRQRLLQVACVFAADGAGRYQRRHSQHRRRGSLRVGSIPRASPEERLYRDASWASSPRREPYAVIEVGSDGAGAHGQQPSPTAHSCARPVAARVIQGASPSN